VERKEEGILMMASWVRCSWLRVDKSSGKRQDFLLHRYWIRSTVLMFVFLQQHINDVLASSVSNARSVFPDAFSWIPGLLRGSNKGFAIRFD